MNQLTDDEVIKQVELESSLLTEKFCELCGGYNIISPIQACVNVISTCLQFAEPPDRKNTAEMIRKFADFLDNWEDEPKKITSLQ